MQNNLYIDFTINDKNKFRDLVQTCEVIVSCRKTRDSKTDEFWLQTFPDHALKNYFFGPKDIVQPSFGTADIEGFIWHFYSMIDYLVKNLDVTLLECQQIEDDRGRLEFYPNGYPYGGIEGLIMFLQSFGCYATKIDEGSALYKVKWISDTEYKLIEISGGGSWWQRFRDFLTR